jgi:hypothetical protein
MALSTQSANLVRQKTYMINRNPGVFYALKALFLHLAANKNNPDLQLVNIDGINLASDGGNTTPQVVANVGCTLYAIYTIKRGTTSTWLKYNDSATTVVGNGTDSATINYANTVAGEERLALFPVGQVFANGISLSEQTTATGTTQTLKANRIEGFIILGA